MLSSSIYNHVTKFLKRQKPSDKESFYNTYQQLSGKMYSLCIRYAGTPVDAREVFIKGMSVLYNDLQPFSHYQLIEKKARHIFVKCSIDHLLSKEKDLFKNIPMFLSQRKINLENMDKYTEAELVQRITQLPTHYRVVFNLYLVENYSIANISELLDINKIIVTSLINKAKLIFIENTRQRV